MNHTIEELPWSGWGVQVAELRRKGWQPRAFTEFIVKIHGWCNLACDYCYVYEMADQSWRAKPRAMSRDTFDGACRMIAQHAAMHAVPAVDLVFHGGEPLLAGSSELEYFARTARHMLEPDVQVRLGIQTNGVLIDEDVLRICDRWNIKIGVSLDGGRAEHDRHRLDRRGQGSYDRVAAGLERLLADERRRLFTGLLCTVDLRNDPIETYDALLRFSPPSVDFLLPHGNWTTPPPGRTSDPAATPYADWLLPIFDRWYGAPELETRVRLFDCVIDLLLGRDAGSELLGLAPVRLAVIETDGSLEQVDELKSAFEGAAGLRLGVRATRSIRRSGIRR
ncbi:FxsB family cyclophane-forming radical SAM/SPASM peptide maturase [Nocardia sp. NPDC004722]